MHPKLLSLSNIRARVHFLSSTIYCDISPIAFSIQLLIQMAFRHKYRNHGKKPPQYPSDGLMILWACQSSLRRGQCVGEERAHWRVADFSSFKTATAFNTDPSNFFDWLQGAYAPAPPFNVKVLIRLQLANLSYHCCRYHAATLLTIMLRMDHGVHSMLVGSMVDQWLCISLFVRCYLAPWKEWSWNTLDAHWQFLSSEAFVQVHGRVQLGYHSHRYR